MSHQHSSYGKNVEDQSLTVPKEILKSPIDFSSNISQGGRGGIFDLCPINPYQMSVHIKPRKSLSTALQKYLR